MYDSAMPRRSPLLMKSCDIILSSRDASNTPGSETGLLGFCVFAFDFL